MAALTWSQFKKRTLQNLRRFHEYVVDGAGFVLEKDITVYGRTVPAGDSVKLIGLAYKSTRTLAKSTKSEQLQGCKTEDYKCIYPADYGRNVRKFINRFKNYYRSKTDSDFGKKLFVITEDRQVHSIGILSKTTDFGGREVSMNSRNMKWGHLESIAAAENLTLLKPGKTVEADWLDNFNELVGAERERRRKRGESMLFDLKVGSVTIPNCVGAMGAPGASSDPKADIVFLYYKNGKDLRITGFTSLKEGSTPKDFQQWGGLSGYRDHEEVKKYVKDLEDQYPNGAPSGKNIGREIDDRSLKIEAIYGPLYAKGRYNSDSVQLIVQGQPISLSGNDVKVLKVEGSIHSDDEMDDLLNGPARPVFMARKGDRSDFGVPGTRIFVYPKAGRTNWEMI